jgi:dihydroorotase
MPTIEITRPDDWHVHLRDGPALRDTVRDISRCFARAIVMPNLAEPVTSVEMATQYRQRILSFLPRHSKFEPLMTLYLTDQTSRDTVRKARDSGLIHAFKIYPAGVTTNADAGVRVMESIYPLFEEMAKQNMPLLIHGEVADASVDIFDREAVFIDRHLRHLIETFPELKVVLEHISTTAAVEFIQASAANVAATITVHHLLYNRNDMLADGIKSFYYCKPILKRSVHQQALIEAATSGCSKYFLGTDSAPHAQSDKENCWGCAAGAYTAHAAIELYAEVFEKAGALERLEGFASHFGADFYGLPRNKDTIRLEKQSWLVADRLSFGDQRLIPIRSGQLIDWSTTG